MGHAGDSNAHTPNLDRLAASGAIFERAYTQNPVCVPSRNCILLGRYTHSSGVISNRHATPRDLITFPQHLRSKGYKTACFGKLHVWDHTDLDWDEQRAAEFPLIDLETSKGTAGTFAGFNPLGQPASFPEEETSEWEATRDTVRFIEDNRDRPWMVQCSFSKPHPPFQPPQRYWDMIDRSKLEIPRYADNVLDDVNPMHWGRMTSRQVHDRTDEQILDGMQGYYGNIAFCDALFGEVLDALDRLGLREDTLVMYTADHGEMLYRHRLWAKGCFFEESAHVPLLISLPGEIPEGRKCSALIEQVDLFPTMMDFLGLETPEMVQGRSFIGAATGNSDSHREFVRGEYYYGPAKKDILRMQFDGRWKYIDNGPELKPELYDLENDPQELTNLSGEAEHQSRVEKLRNELNFWSQQDVVHSQPRNKPKDR